MPKFKTGETVQLNSGGPPMTVVSYVDESVQCVWFDGEAKVQRKYFDESLLTPTASEPNEKS